MMLCPWLCTAGDGECGWVGGGGVLCDAVSLAVYSW